MVILLPVWRFENLESLKCQKMFDSSLRSRQSADNQPQSVKPKLVTCFVLSARKLNGYVVFDLRSSNRICLQLSRCKQGFRSLSDRMTWQMRACCMQCVQHCSTAAVSPWLVICSAHLILLHHHRHSILVKIEHTKTNMLMTKWDGDNEERWLTQETGWYWQG